MASKQTRIDELSEKILKGLRKAPKNLVETRLLKIKIWLLAIKNGT